MRRGERDAWTRGVGLGLAIGAALVTALSATAARGDDTLAGLGLFVSPERRAALDAASGPDGAIPAPAPTVADSPVEPAAGASGASPDASGPVGAAPRAGAPPPGSAVLRSSRGVSRIVDGRPLPGGPS